jgi:hypothetical protein
MRLLTPLCTILLTIALCCASYAQCSPIYLDDNGGVPIEFGKQGSASGKAKKLPKDLKTVQPSYFETHIHYHGGKKYDDQIQYNAKTKEYFIDRPNYHAVCLETPSGDKIDLATNKRWILNSIAEMDNTFISSDGMNNKHIHIDPGKNMGFRPNDMTNLDDPDPAGPNGKKNQMISAKFRPSDSDDGTTYEQISLKTFIIHYCGPAGCIGDDGKTDQCADVSIRKKP